jgi:hypothetical protein
LTEDDKIIIAGLAFAISTIATLLFLFGNKTYLLVYKPDKKKVHAVTGVAGGVGNSAGTTTGTTAAVSAPGSTDTYLASGQVDRGSAVVESGVAVVAASVSTALKGMSVDAKVAFIHEQMNQWRALLVKYNEEDFQHSGDTNSDRVAYENVGSSAPSSKGMFARLSQKLGISTGDILASNVNSTKVKLAVESEVREDDVEAFDQSSAVV